VATPASNAPRSSDASGDSGAVTHTSVRPSGEVVAVTERDDFLLELGESLGGQISLRPVDTVVAALEHLSGARQAQLLALDSRGLADPRAEVDRAHGQFPHVPIVVFALSETERSVASALKGCNIFAVLPIPVDRRKTAAILEGALADASARRGGTRALPPAAAERPDARPPLVPEPASAAESFSVEGLEPGSPRAGSPVAWIAAAIGALALAGGVAWYFLAPHSPAATGGGSSALKATTNALEPPAASASASVEAAPQAAAVPLVQGNVDELLEKARLAMRERRYTEPAGNSALLYYRSVLGVDPANGEARDGMERLARLLMTRFDDDFSAGHYDEAASALAGLKVAAPQDAHVPSLEARLLQAEVEGAFAAGNLDRASVLVHQAQLSSAVPAAAIARWRTELGRHEDDARIKHLEDLFAARLREGKLIDPSEDSAKYYLDELRSAAPNDPVAEHGTRELLAAYLRKARDAALAQHPEESARWTEAARAAGASTADLAAYQQELTADRQHAASAQADHLAGLARARLDDGHITDPANDSAVYYLEELKRAAPQDASVALIGRELSARLIERATADARSGRTAQMSSDLTLARTWGADPALLEAVAQIAGGPKASAPAEEPRAPQLPPGFAPKRIYYQAPDYPDNALDARVSGAVTVRFTVDYDGHPRDVHVVSSKPAGVFDHAAVIAVQHWRYQPVVVDHVAMEVPSGAIIRFEAPQ